jgi:hypothetical protein
VALEGRKKRREEGVLLPSLHSSRFAPRAEPSIRTGVAAMGAAALEILGR